MQYQEIFNGMELGQIFVLKKKRDGNEIIFLSYFHIQGQNQYWKISSYHIPLPILNLIVF